MLKNYEKLKLDETGIMWFVFIINRLVFIKEFLSSWQVSSLNNSYNDHNPGLPFSLNTKLLIYGSRSLSQTANISK